MAHKAFVFDWDGFAAELLTPLTTALAADDPGDLAAYIDARRAFLSDPYEGNPLTADWRAALVNHDVHEYGDYALTRFYDPADDHGLDDAWAELSDCLSAVPAAALLGRTVGAGRNVFDPGRCGSYFQTPDQVRESFALLKPLGVPELTPFVDLLDRCSSARRGVYVTF